MPLARSATPAPAHESSATTSLRALLAGPVAGVSRSADVGRVILRVVAGLSLAFAHGIGKIPPSDQFVGMVAGMGLPAPGLLAWLAALTEFGGGVLLALGLLTRLAALLITVSMLVAAVLAHAGDPYSTREPSVLYMAIALLYLFAGPGRYSLDAALFRRARDALSS